MLKLHDFSGDMLLATETTITAGRLTQDMKPRPPTPPPVCHCRASLRDSECEISNGDWAGGKEWDGAVNSESGNRGYLCQRCQSSRAEHEWTHPPPSPRFRLVFPYVPPPSLPLSLLLSPSVLWNITVGQKSPHWRLQGCIMRINELEVNMQAVCCLPHYTSQP